MRARAENLKSGSVPLLPSTLKGLQKYGADAKLETQLRDMVVH
jgi:hypothetical protein